MSKGNSAGELALNLAHYLCAVFLCFGQLEPVNFHKCHIPMHTHLHMQ
jgi:hypothetical protein